MSKKSTAITTRVIMLCIGAALVLFGTGFLAWRVMLSQQYFVIENESSQEASIEQPTDSGDQEELPVDNQEESNNISN